MIFNQGQIQDMLSILKRYELVFIAGQLGLDFLSQSDKDILIAAGVNLDKYKNKKGVVEHAFLFGILAEAIGDARAKKMTYAQFQKFLASGNFIPLTEEEEFALQTVKNRAYTDITSLGNRMRTGLSNVVLKNNQSQSVLVQQMIKQKTIKAVELRMGARGLAADLAETSQDWEVDWLRIAYYLTHEAYNSGRAQSILKEYGADSEVYFDVYPGACQRCRELYLTDPEDPDSEPIVFKLKDIIANGNNIGRKVKEWKPTISPTHPYCRCTINHKKVGFAWDAELRAFTKPIKKISANPKLKGVKLNIKVSKGEENDFEKAHQDGDIHSNGKWVWRSSANKGKGDWRALKTSKETSSNDDLKKLKQSKSWEFSLGLSRYEEEKKSGKWNFEDMSNLSEEEKTWLVGYLSNSYSKINKEIRNNSISKETEIYIKHLKKSISKLKDYDGVVYRNISFNLNSRKENEAKYNEIINFFKENKGKEIISKEFLSSGKNKKKIDKKFSSSGFDIKFVISSKSGKDLSKYNDEEEEILFNIGTKFKIVSVTKNIVKLEEL